MFNPSEISTFYVSKKYGDDRHNFGFSPENRFLAEGPVATLETALTNVAELRNDGHNQPITIFILDEEYPLEKPIVLDHEMHSVTIRPYTKTLIHGGLEIKGFERDTFNGQECFSAYIPEVAEKGLWFTDFYVDGERAKVTRFPQQGKLDPVAIDNESTLLDTSCEWFIAKKEDAEKIAKFKNFDDCIISYNHYWIDAHTPMKSCDPESGKIEFLYPSRYSLSTKHGRSALHYVIDNVAECFCNHNEWYLDRETSKVYYIPRDKAQTPENIKAYAPILDKLFVLQGRPDKKLINVHLEGLDFAYTRGDYLSRGTGVNFVFHPEDETPKAADAQSVHLANGSVELFNTHGCYVENCNLFCLGLHALTVNEGCSQTYVCNNHIYDIGAGGIKMGGQGYNYTAVKVGNVHHDYQGNYPPEDSRLETHGNIVRNNFIEKCGRRHYAGCGILMKDTYNNYIGHNEITDLYYTGISLGWVWGYYDNMSHDNLIEKNYIHDIGCGVLSDMGGVYILGKQPGTIVRGNLIHDVHCFEYGAWGIYCDEGACYVTVENNLCYNNDRNGYHQHYGRMNTIRNNIFAKNKQAAANVSCPFVNNNAIFERNILVTMGPQPTYVSMYDDESAPSSIIAHSNLLYNVDGKVKAMGQKDANISLEEFQTIYGNEKYSIEADPLFVDYENNDFRLKENSPAYSIGFRPIDFSDVGIQK